MLAAIHAPTVLQSQKRVFTCTLSQIKEKTTSGIKLTQMGKNSHIEMDTPIRFQPHGGFARRVSPSLHQLFMPKRSPTASVGPIGESKASRRFFFGAVHLGGARKMERRGPRRRASKKLVSECSAASHGRTYSRIVGILDAERVKTSGLFVANTKIARLAPAYQASGTRPKNLCHGAKKWPDKRFGLGTSVENQEWGGQTLTRIITISGKSSVFLSCEHHSLAH